MVLDFSLELKHVEGKCKNVENRFKERQEGEARIIYDIKLLLQAYRYMWTTLKFCTVEEHKKLKSCFVTAFYS